MVAGAVGINPELVANDSAGPRFPLETGHVDRQHLGTNEALVEQGQPVVLGGRGDSQQHNSPPTHRGPGQERLAPRLAAWQNFGCWGENVACQMSALG